MAKGIKYASASAITRDVLELVKAPSRAPVSDTISDLLYVEQGGVMAPYDKTLTPYMDEPLDAITSRKYDAVVFVGPARSGKSLALIEGALAHSAVVTKADVLLVHITQPRCAEFSKKNVYRSFEASPTVKAAMSTNKHDNGIHLIKMKAGNFLSLGWPSKNVFASATYKVVLMTDLDRMPLNVDGEGSPFLLAGKRTQTYMSSGMVVAESSPGHEIVDPAYRPATPHE
ncbi:MAG: phage terminase large subunit family protein, partial [Aeromonas veronii]